MYHFAHRMEGPHVRANRFNTAGITKDHHQGPPASHLEEGSAREAPPGVGRTPSSTEPRQCPLGPTFHVAAPE